MQQRNMRVSQTCGMIEVHKSITVERVEEAVDRRMTSLDNPGFCLVCGCENGGCEPDAREYQCEACGEKAVMGADDLLWELAP